MDCDTETDEIDKTDTCFSGSLEQLILYIISLLLCTFLSSSPA